LDPVTATIGEAVYDVVADEAHALDAVDPGRRDRGSTTSMTWLEPYRMTRRVAHRRGCCRPWAL
jgi:hypothetical protein